MKGFVRTEGTPNIIPRIDQLPMQIIRRNVMGMNKDQTEGRVKQAEGKIKEIAGKLVGNEKLEAKGKVQRVLGKAQAKFGDVKQDVKDSAKKHT